MIIDDLTIVKIREKGIKLRCKSESRMMKLLGFFVPSFLTSWVTLGKTIWYPVKVQNPLEHLDIIEHELIHVEQYDNVGGIDFPDWFWVLLYVFFPVPIFFAYFRWRVERRAYLTQLKFVITEGCSTSKAYEMIDQVVNALWEGYFYC